jgi:transketolase
LEDPNARYSLRDAFGAALVKAGGSSSEVVVLDADVAHPTRAYQFRDMFPHRFFQMGIAEANMIGVAAGLATLGLIPFAITFAAFVSRRACDQVYISVAYPRLNVKIVGAYAGLSSYSTGATHQSMMDMAIMRAIPGMTVVEPADPLQLEQLMDEIVSHDGPCYLRIMRDDVPLLSAGAGTYTLGRGEMLRAGTDVTIVALGTMASHCLDAADLLAREGVSARVLNIHTLKPLDGEILVEAASATGRIVTVENHSIIGGLGSAVAEELAERQPCLMKRVGIRDAFGRCGMPRDLMAAFGMTPPDIAKAAFSLLG